MQESSWLFVARLAGRTFALSGRWWWARLAVRQAWDIVQGIPAPQSLEATAEPTGASPLFSASEKWVLVSKCPRWT